MKRTDFDKTSKNIIKALIGAIAIGLVCVALCALLSGCDWTAQDVDIRNTYMAGSELMQNQPTPTDLEYSLERYNLIRRAYWVNGQREKAINLPCEITKPLGYIVLFTDSGSVVGRFTVDGKVSSLNSFLTPDSEEYSSSFSEWLPDVDGSFGENDSGIFFFTADGKYIEWNGAYIYSDIPFEVDTPSIVIGGDWQ